MDQLDGWIMEAFFFEKNSISNTLMDHKHLFYLCEQLAKIMQKIQLSNIQQSLV